MNKEIVGKRIRDRRKSCGLTMERLACQADVDLSTVSRAERSGKLPRLECIMLIADALDCTVGYLLGETDNPSKH